MENVAVHALRLGIGIVWLAFWVYWLAAAGSSRRSISGQRRFGGVTVIATLVLLRFLVSGKHDHSHVQALAIVGAVLFLAGLGVAVWARLHLGTNWGTPMSQRAEPDLITTGPYRHVRHPIYSGLILAFVGTSLAESLIGLAVTALLAAYFYWSATVEERNLTTAFPTAYPAYQARTKKLIPFLL